MSLDAATASSGEPTTAALLARAQQVADQLHREGFVPADVDADDLWDYLAPFVEPAAVPEFQFNREWMREQFQRINNPREPTYTVAIKLNLPPSYMLIHRVTLGSIGVLCQLEAQAPYRSILEKWLPGFAPVA